MSLRNDSLMADKKTIAVVGATGAQGGGLVRAILEDAGGGFRVRAITRNVNGEKTQELARAGAEVVAADTDDAESMKRALAGAYQSLLWWVNRKLAADAACGRKNGVSGKWTQTAVLAEN